MTASSHPVRGTGQEPRGSYKALQECCSQKALNTSTGMYTQLDGIESGRKNTREEGAAQQLPGQSLLAKEPSFCSSACYLYYKFTLLTSPKRCM